MSDEVVKPGNEEALSPNQSLSEAIKDKIFNKIYFYILVSFLLVNWQEILILFKSSEDIFYTLSIIFTREGANKRGNSSRLTQSFHFFMFEPIFSPVNALNQPI